MTTQTVYDPTLTRLKLLEALLPLVVGGVVLSIMKPEDAASPLAAPFFAVFALVSLDGLLGFLALRKGIVIDPAARVLHFPRRYTRTTLDLTQVKEMRPTVKIFRDQNFRSHATWFLELEGEFGREKIPFKSEAARDQVLQAIEAAR